MDQNLFFSHSGNWLDQLLTVFLIISPYSILDGLIFDIISEGAFSFLHFEWTSFSENLRLIGAENIKIWGEGYFKICIFDRSENERCLLYKSAIIDGPHCINVSWCKWVKIRIPTPLGRILTHCAALWGT